MDHTSRLAGADLVAGDVRRRIESYGASHAGHVRQANEDHFVIASLQRSVHLRQTNLDDHSLLERLCGPMAYLYAVADGVGGSATA
jgi:serine/threonine protein phosphatase PrpC